MDGEGYAERESVLSWCAFRFRAHERLEVCVRCSRATVEQIRNPKRLMTLLFVTKKDAGVKRIFLARGVQGCLSDWRSTGEQIEREYGAIPRPISTSQDARASGPVGAA